MTTPCIVIKDKTKQRNKRLCIPSPLPPNWNEVVETIHKLTGCTLSSLPSSSNGLRLQYQDEQGDWVSVLSQVEWDVALDVFKLLPSHNLQQHIVTPSPATALTRSVIKLRLVALPEKPHGTQRDYCTKKQHNKREVPLEVQQLKQTLFTLKTTVKLGKDKERVQQLKQSVQQVRQQLKLAKAASSPERGIPKQNNPTTTTPAEQTLKQQQGPVADLRTSLKAVTLRKGDQDTEHKNVTTWKQLKRSLRREAKRSEGKESDDFKRATQELKQFKQQQKKQATSDDTKDENVTTLKQLKRTRRAAKLSEGKESDEFKRATQELKQFKQQQRQTKKDVSDDESNNDDNNKNTLKQLKGALREAGNKHKKELKANRQLSRTLKQQRRQTKLSNTRCLTA